ncbi:MAG: CHAD domain-containing protein [Sandaracinaceae bacterium]
MSSLLERSAADGARKVALDYLAEARAAAEHLVDPQHDEALHDFRVALRRLRATLRAYRSLVEDSVSKKLRKRIAKVASATNGGRDAEVQLAWVERVASDVPSGHAPGTEWLIQRLTRERDEGYARVQEGLLSKFRELDERLEPRLRRYTVEREVDAGPDADRFAGRAAEAIDEARAALNSAFAHVHGIEDEALAHKARIRVKRARYLLEPFKDELDEARGAIASLKALQDLLGELNDLHVVHDTIGSGLEDTALSRARRLREAAERPDFDLDRTLAEDERAGLLALLARAQEERRARFATLLDEWLGDGGRLRALDGELDAVAAALRAHASPPLEIERKYLLDGVPPRCRELPPVTIDQGYLPGQSLIERVRRSRTESGVTHVRTVKLGRGITRVEVEEECDAATFEALWALTLTRRVRKRRYRVPEGDRVWEIDSFDDRDLTLAEIELASADEDVALPEWLAPHVVREVTDEPEYVNARLAK